jgi:dethiobiotin synthetase
MNRGCFVTGTDTGVGKTRTARALLTVFGQQLGCRAVGMKPVASGAIETPDGLRNPDALALQAAANVEVPYADVNPYLFAPATAPHLAAAAVGAEISTGVISNCFARLATCADVVVVEGAGGWLTPIGPRQSMADVAAILGLPVILVVAMRLGCINHAVLTAQAILGAGIPLAGWVENRIEADPDGVLDGYSQALAERISAPRLGVLPRRVPDRGASAGDFELGRLVQLTHGKGR